MQRSSDCSHRLHQVNRANCLIKNLIEIDSLPHLRNLTSSVRLSFEQIRARLPFPLRRIDSGNGSEFINNHPLLYCQREKIALTRWRAGNRNDRCFVEQNSYSELRRAAGYARYDAPAQQRLSNTLCGHMRLYASRPEKSALRPRSRREMPTSSFYLGVVNSRMRCCSSAFLAPSSLYCAYNWSDWRVSSSARRTTSLWASPTSSYFGISVVS
jgi:hypothetical protein